MGTLTVRNVPDKVVRALKALARANGFSMEQQVRTILREQAIDRAAVIDHLHVLWDEFMGEVSRAEVDRWKEEGRRGARP